MVYDFVHCRTDNGKAFRTLNIIDEYSRECLAIRVKRKLNSADAIEHSKSSYQWKQGRSSTNDHIGPVK